MCFYVQAEQIQNGNRLEKLFKKILNPNNLLKYEFCLSKTVPHYSYILYLACIKNVN